jgi:hypothetical protein
MLAAVLTALLLPAGATASDHLIVVKHRKIQSFGGFAPQGADTEHDQCSGRLRDRRRSRRL